VSCCKSLGKVCPANGRVSKARKPRKAALPQA
jgi:hypothetical protein